MARIAPHSTVVQEGMFVFAEPVVRDTGPFTLEIRARGPESQDPVLKKLAVKYDVTLTRIVLGWGLSRGVGLATQSKSELHRKQTLNLPELDPEDVKEITALDRKQFAYVRLDRYGTLLGWTPEQYGCDHLKMSQVPAGGTIYFPWIHAV